MASAQDRNTKRPRDSASAGADSPSAKKTKPTKTYPADWPADGEIDLATADLPHDSAETEWWYVNSHVQTAEGKELSFFLSYFRSVHKRDATTGELSHTHALTWAIVDPEKKRYFQDAIVDPRSPEILKKAIEEGKYHGDDRINRALMEVVEKGNVPLPDRVFPEQVTVDRKVGELKLDFGGVSTFEKDSQGRYHVKASNPDGKCTIDVVLTPQKKPVRQGNNGVTRVGQHGDEMFYYYIPRNTAEGSVTLDGTSHQVTGHGWYDHEFGGTFEDKPKTEEEKKAAGPRRRMAWNWLSVQLDNGSEYTATNLHNIDTDKCEDLFCVETLADETRTEYLDIDFEGRDYYVSSQTIAKYPTKYHLKIPAAQVDLDIVADFPFQEFRTLIAKPAFWEGRMTVTGTVRGQKVTGRGFVERNGWDDLSSLKGFFARVNEEVKKSIDTILPHNPEAEDVLGLIADDTLGHYTDGFSIETFKKTVVGPLREIVDRGGKSWRSYACLVCCDAVGGDSEVIHNWLAMPEMMHVGSLIIDDIQDESEQRRGGPTLHKMIGQSLAINAGNAAYFIGERIIPHTSLTPEIKVRLYQLYFQALRAGHAGQAFDIHGLDAMFEKAVESGEGDEIVNHVICTHRLKSAAPACNLARMGAIVGGGSEEQIHAIGQFFENLGVAFQIVDDVLNLRGFVASHKGGKIWKTLGEDIAAGKVTFPIAMCINRMKDVEQRRKLWATVKSKPKQPEQQAEIDACIAEIEACGALSDSAQKAVDLIDDAWKVLDKVIPDSFFKLMLRAFGWYVLERHY